MLNKVPNNNDITRIENVVLNEEPNSNDATCVANNVCLTTYHRRTIILIGSYIADIMQKS